MCHWKLVAVVLLSGKFQDAYGFSNNVFWSTRNLERVTYFLWNTCPSRCLQGKLGAVRTYRLSVSATSEEFPAATTPQQKMDTDVIHSNRAVDAEDGDDPEKPSPLPFRRVSTYCVKGVTRRAGPLNEAVAQICNMTLDEANDLVDIGAVWAKMDVLSEEDILSLYDEDDDITSSSRALYADLEGMSGMSGDGEEDDLDKYIELAASLRFRRVLTPSWIEAGTDIRVYPNPRRFPACEEMNPSSILYEDTTFIVVDKPPMLPTQPDSSNYYENCPGCVQDKLGPFFDINGREIHRPLLCHRVDSCVGGCVVLSKDRNGQKVFHEMQRNRKLRKVYLAVTTKPVPLGMHLHWMWSPQSARGKSGGPPCQLVRFAPPESRRKAREFWDRCVLEVVKCEPIEINAEKDGHSYNPQIKQQQHYQSTIRLVTGRKHQVRAQLAALGAPIIRDTLYEPMAGLTLDDLGDAENLLDESMGRARVPTEPIGLQAHAILFGGIRAKARIPWWGNRILLPADQEEQEMEEP